jgi:hypothetical protein
MQLKLIQSGGFTGRRKVAEEELSDHPEALKAQVEDIFSQPTPPEGEGNEPGDLNRDKPVYYVEYNGKSLPLDNIPANQHLEKLIESMKEKLHY